MTTPGSRSQPQPDPWFTVVTGDPSDEELAALTVVLAAAVAKRASGPGAPAAPGWSSRARLLRTPLTPGRDAWRRSNWPG